MFENIGAPELLVVLLVVLIFFGPKKIPELAQGIGKGIREFRKATRGIQETVETEIKNIGQESRSTETIWTGSGVDVKKCPKCGTENSIGSNFCKECGAGLMGQSVKELTEIKASN